MVWFLVKGLLFKGKYVYNDNCSKIKQRKDALFVLKVEQRDGIMEAFEDYMGDTRRCWFCSLFWFWFRLSINLSSTSSLSFHVLIFPRFTVRLLSAAACLDTWTRTWTAIGWQLIAEMRKTFLTFASHRFPRGLTKNRNSTTSYFSKKHFGVFPGILGDVR